jgi:hypothetical protein
MYASAYAIHEKWSAVFLRLHMSVFDRAASMTFLKELLRLVARRGGSDDRGQVKGGDKVNLAMALHI